MKRTFLVVTLIAMVLAACGDDESNDTAAESVNIPDALETKGEVVVTGYLFVLDDGRVVLAEMIAESFPPQPGGATIIVEGLDLADLALEQAPEDSELATTQWSDEPITLTGSMVSGVLEEAVHSQRP